MKTPNTAHQLKVQGFYEEVSQDYLFWDEALNMHFGYCNSIQDFFSNARALKSLNRKVLNMLILGKPSQKLIDLGCGMGGTMIQATNEFPNLEIKGVSISQTQTQIGNQKLAKQSSPNQIIQGDYEALPFPDDKFDGAYAIESFCHSGCSSKALSEAYRVLKPGAKLVISDAFTKQEFMPNSALKIKYAMQNKWRLKELISIEKCYERANEVGFRLSSIEDISFRVAPSLLRVPFTIAKFYFDHWRKGKKMSKVSKDNAWASFYALLTGLFIPYFGYYIVVMYKPKS